MNNSIEATILSSSGGNDPRESYRCSLEGGTQYSLRDVHWFRFSSHGEWIKVRTECVPRNVIRDQLKLSRGYYRG